jgi:hypothetical protein
MTRKMGRNAPEPNPRRYLTAYLRTQDLHKQLHRCTKAFEENFTDAEILSRLHSAQSLLTEILEILQ